MRTAARRHGASLIRNLLAAIASVGLYFGNLAHASTITLEFQYSGASFGNDATAIGFITIDPSVLPFNKEITPATNLSLPSPAVTAIQITVENASVGNGTFGISEFSGVTFLAGGALDLSTPLVGQVLPDGCLYGLTAYDGCGLSTDGDFNFFSNGTDPLAPTGTLQFTLTTGYGVRGDGGEILGDKMILTSLDPVPVPEPSTALMVVSGLLVLPFLRRRGNVTWPRGRPATNRHRTAG